ncbi:unnamed protein product [Schistosoma mattheei]|uniref:DUF4806 domain-containing protein n=2 Tax=Schistosoma mattheei TaxID=31246 RepID=A0AA85BMT1_9TREM|nr:unnamed protein product [Schistosoma mattheei]
MSSIEVSENVRRRRATVNLSRSLVCHRSTYNRRWNKMRAALMKNMTFFRSVSLLMKAQSKLIAVEREINCNENLSTVAPSTRCSNQRLLDNNGCNDVNVLTFPEGALKRKEGFLYNSEDMDVAEMQAGNSHVQYPRFRLFDRVTSPIANSTPLDTSPSTLESKHLDCALAAQFDRLYTMMQNISSAIIDLSKNVKLLLAKLSERENPHHFDCGLSSQQFPLSSEEELQMLDTDLQQKEMRDRFMAMVTRLMDNNPKTSMRYILSYLMTPEVASNFTLLGTSSKRALQKCRFYGCIRSALTNRFSSSSVKEKDLAKLYDIATQGYFHDIRDKLTKRHRRKQDQFQSTVLTNITVS